MATDAEAKNFNVVNQSSSLMNEDPTPRDASRIRERRTQLAPAGGAAMACVS